MKTSKRSSRLDTDRPDFPGLIAESRVASASLANQVRCLVPRARPIMKIDGDLHEMKDAAGVSLISAA
jgi:hypothetical protein